MILFNFHTFQYLGIECRRSLYACTSILTFKGMVSYYLCKKYITKKENWSFIDNRHTNYCSIMDQYLVWYPLASMMAAILRGMDSYRKLRYSGGGLSLDLERNSF